MRTYQHSGTVPFLGAIQALAIGSAAAIVLGIVYTFTFYYIPYVYLNFVLAMGFGAGVGWAVGWGAREGKVRNTSVTVALAVVAALAGIYAEWGSTIYALVPGNVVADVWSEMGLASFLPHNILGLMFDLFQEGSWGLSGGAMVKGWMLVCLWIIEAGMIIGLAGKVAHMQLADRPFCEACNEWITGETPHVYQGDGSEPVWTEVQNGNFDPLADTEQAFGTEHTFVRLKLHVCETCTESNYLTITRCEHTVDHKGNERLVETNLVTNLAVDETQVELIRTARLIAPVPGMPPLGPPVAEPGMTGEAVATSGAKAPGTNWTLQS
jgi:hypothetical protein